MKIKALAISNFRGVKFWQTSPANLNVLIGKNGKGKSSILDAIRFCLTGEASKKDILHGEKEATVVIQFEDGDIFKRTLIPSSAASGSQKCFINDKETTISNAEKYVENKIGCKMSVFKGLCGSDYLSSLPEKEMTNFLISLMPVTLNHEVLLQYLEKYIGKPATEDLKSKTISYFKEGTFGIDEIDKVYSVIFSERREKKKILKTHIEKSKFDQSLIENLPSAEVLRNEMKDLLEERGKVNIMREIEKKKKILESLKKEYRTYQNLQKPDNNELIKIKKDMKKFQDVIQRYQKMIGTLESNISFLQKTLNGLNHSMCPLSDKLVCTTDKTAAKSELQNLLMEDKKAIAEHKKFILSCQEQVRKREKMVDDFNQRVIQWNKKESLENEIKNLNIPQMKETEKIRSIEELNKKIAEIEKMQDIWVAYEIAQKSQIAAAEVRKDVDILETLVSAFGGKGIKTMIMSHTIEMMSKESNKIAKKINPELEVRFDNSNGLKMLAKFHNNGFFVPIEKLSSGEQVITTFLIMSIINSITGAKMLVIDSLDRLDKESLQAFLELLMESDMYDCIFFGMVDHQDTLESLQQFKETYDNRLYICHMK